MTGRTRRERDEWALAGELASGLARARLARALAGAAENHRRAEGL